MKCIIVIWASIQYAALVDGATIHVTGPDERQVEFGDGTTSFATLSGGEGYINSTVTVYGPDFVTMTGASVNEMMTLIRELQATVASQQARLDSQQARLDSTAYASCIQRKNAANTAGLTFTPGYYTVTLPSGTDILTHCDAGGWTMVLKFTSQTDSDDLIDVNAVGDFRNFSTASNFTKLDDVDINAINALTNSTTYFKFFCDDTERYVYRADGYISAINQQGWQTDRNLDGIMDCQADRTNYMFSDYPDRQLSGATASCGISGHLNWFRLGYACGGPMGGAPGALYVY